MACGEFQRPESLWADKKELGSQSPEFPWHEEEDDEDEDEEWEPPPQDCALQDVRDKETCGDMHRERAAQAPWAGTPAGTVP